MAPTDDAKPSQIKHLRNLDAPEPGSCASELSKSGLKANHDKASRAARKKAFEAQFGDWIAAQNARFETQGIPGADLRPW